MTHTFLLPYNYINFYLIYLKLNLSYITVWTVTNHDQVLTVCGLSHG
jgi:hypothetical protein